MMFEEHKQMNKEKEVGVSHKNLVKVHLVF